MQAPPIAYGFGARRRWIEEVSGRRRGAPRRRGTCCLRRIVAGIEGGRGANAKRASSTVGQCGSADCHDLLVYGVLARAPPSVELPLRDKIPICGDPPREVGARNDDAASTLCPSPPSVAMRPRVAARSPIGASRAHGCDAKRLSSPLAGSGIFEAGAG